MSYVIGIDVAGRKRGFHVAVINLGNGQLVDVFRRLSAIDIVSEIQKKYHPCDAIAIDCPPLPSIRGPLTREAERELNRAGYRIQWTRRGEAEVLEWMENGNKLWEELKKEFSDTKLIETFPTASFDGLHASSFVLPLRMFQGRQVRKDIKDYIDACVCAETGRFYLRNEDKVRIWGKDDEIGPIYTL